MEWAYCIYFFALIFLSWFLIVLFDGEFFDRFNISKLLRRDYCSICDMILKMQEQDDFFKQIHLFKRLLRRVECRSILSSRVPCCYTDSNSRQKTKEEKIWQLTEHRQLFTPDELTFIDSINKKIANQKANTKPKEGAHTT